MKLTVLIVDTSWEEAEQIKKDLRSINEYNVSINHVRNPENALKSIEHTTPDLVLIEHQLNNDTALTLAREIRMNNYSLPMIVVTDNGDEQICSKYFRIGIDDFLVKTQAGPNLLHTRIKYVLAHRKNKVERKRAAMFDELTNLYNRRFSFKRIREEMTSAVRHHHSFSLCLIDLDGFKEVNDQFGHMSGDFLLKRVSELLKKSVRTDDIVGRYGGDEFLIGLRNTDSSGAYQAAQKLTDEVGNAIFHPPAEEQIKINCSIGVAEFNGNNYDHSDEIEPVEEFIDRADQALYVAKEQGPGTAERRRNKRYSLDAPVQVNIEHYNSQASAWMVDVSRKGVRLEEGPLLQEGQQITLNFETRNSQKLEQEGIIRSCKLQEDTAKAILGVEIVTKLPQTLIEERKTSGIN